MSSHRGDLSSTNPPQENISSPKKLAASRWAPGGFEDQSMANQNTAKEQTQNNKANTPPANGIHSSRWAMGPAEHNQTLHKKKANFNQKGHKISENNRSNLIRNQPRPRTNNYELPSTTRTMVAPRRLVGPLTDEEKTVNMENPFFDPEKHKGLGSSRWANNDEPSSITQTNFTPRRIIGPLSEEETTVHMENPFFDPKKHKGLGSSRWAN